MAWSTPNTEASGNVWTAAHYNTYVRDNTNALRDYMLGAQDLGAAWKLSGGRSLGFDDATNIAHGITTIAATSIWGSIQKVSGTAGGAQFIGLSDTGGYGMILEGIVGNSTPTSPALALQGAKKNGTGIQDVGASESVFQFLNNATDLGRWYGNGGLNVAGGLVLGYSGVPNAGVLTIADSNYGLYLSGGNAYIQFDTGSDYLQYNRTSNLYTFYVGGAGVLVVTSTGAGIYDAGLVLVPSGGGGGAGAQVAGSILLREITEPGVAGGANEGRFFLKDNGSGKTQACVRFQSGASQVFATEP